MITRIFAIAIVALFCSVSHGAQPAGSPPEWARLTSEQRAVLRNLEKDWDSMPGERRGQLLAGADRWLAMTPEQQSAVSMIFGQTWRIVGASLLGFWAGEFVNSLVLAKMKVLTEGKHLWMRTIGSTFAGEAVDSVIFYPLAFLGTWSTEQVVSVMIGNYFIKVFWEVLATPVTYKIVAFLKRTEHEDYFDRNTNFNPFTLEVQPANGAQ